jgi:hypothetical protein
MGMPILLLLAYEAWAKYNHSVMSRDYIRYLERRAAPADITASPEADEADNRKGKRVIAVGTMVTGVLMLVLGLHAIESTWTVTAMSGIILITGCAMYAGTKKKVIQVNVNNKDTK